MKRKENVLFSIIVPVYNLEKYISICLDSLYNQGLDMSLYEVVVVNDGSDDNTLNIVNQYKMRYPNLKVLSQENAGVSVARNRGIVDSSGEYVLFVDGDDWIEPYSLDKIYELIKKYGKKIDIWVLRSFLESGQERYSWLSYGIKDHSLFHGMDFYRLRYNRGSVWGGLYKRELLINNDIRFPVGVKNGEDSIFFSLVRMNAKNIFFADICFYHVFERQGSASRSMSIERVFGYKNNLDFLEKILRIPSLNLWQKDIINLMIYSCISNAVYAFISINNCEFSVLYNHLRLSRFLPLQLRSGYFKEDLKMRLLNFSFWIYCISRLLFHSMVRIKS